jgi:hypothetical protein
MATGEDYNNPCLVCHESSAWSCAYNQDYKNQHPYIVDNLSYLEYRYVQSVS